MEPSASTINDIFLQLSARAQPDAMRTRRDGTWQPRSSRDIYRDVRAVARALESWGISKGDRVAIIAENRFEWAVVDFACLAIGAVDVPVYPTLTAEQTAFIVSDSGARIAFVSTTEQLAKVASIRERTKIEKIVVMDDVASPSAINLSTLPRYLGERDAAFDARARAIVPGDLATIIYTSGTTGVPKGVKLTHGNLASNVLASIKAFGVGRKDVYVSFLPLSHIFARHIDYAMFQDGVSVAYCADLNTLPEVLREVKPTFFVAVPRVFEKLKATVLRRIGNSGVKRRMYDWALAIGAQHRDDVLAQRRIEDRAWRMADRLVFRAIREGLGGRVQMMISGSAPLGKELAEWYPTVGLALYEGYGLTEASPVISRNTPQDHKIGSVGKILTNLEVRIADDGEILARGPSVFSGYWNQDEETAAAFEGEWFKTGDIGALDADGYLSITDRKKELIKTAGGKFIAPAAIENALLANPLVAHAAVIGDRRKFPVALLAPNFTLLTEWVKKQHLDCPTREAMVAHQQVREIYDGIVDGVNSRLAQFEKLKRFVLVPDEFSIASGELTPTLKLKRRVVEQRYTRELDALYSAVEQQEPVAG